MAQIALYSGFFSGMEEVYRRVLEFTALIFTIPVVAYSAMPFYRHGLFQLRRGLNMDTPIAIAVLVAFGVSFHSTLVGAGETYYDSVVMFTFLMLGARYLERRLRYTLAVEDGVLAALPKEATFVVDGALEQRGVEEIAEGDRLWVAQGAMLPADGLLESDSAVVEEAPITGESDWRRRSGGDRLYAGTFNRGPAIEMLAAGHVGDAYLAQIEKLSNAALDEKHRLKNLADLVARVFVPTILGLSAMTYVGWYWVDPSIAFPAALAVLVVSCPCALSLAIPAAVTAALARLRQLGVLVKNSRALELLPRVTSVLFDKTGTLTSGLRVARVTPAGGRSPDECLRIAGALQSHSSHALSRAFPEERSMDVTEISICGNGVFGNVGDSVVRVGSAEFCGMREIEAGQKAVYMSVDGAPAAVFEIEQAVRKEAGDAVRWFTDEGIRVCLSSGDDPQHCSPVAAALGIDFDARQRPEDKVEAVNALPGRRCLSATASTTFLPSRPRRSRCRPWRRATW